MCLCLTHVVQAARLSVFVLDFSSGAATYGKGTMNGNAGRRDGKGLDCNETKQLPLANLLADSR